MVCVTLPPLPPWFSQPLLLVLVGVSSVLRLLGDPISVSVLLVGVEEEETGRVAAGAGAWEGEGMEGGLGKVGGKIPSSSPTAVPPFFPIP